MRWLCPAAGEAYYSGAVTPEQLERELACSREPVTAVYLTCPDYLGELPDVAALATVCRRAGVLLAVDNAHGAYLKFLSPSRHPMDLGADLCCDSAHKTLPVVTGGAYLHIAHQAPELLHRQAKASMGLWGSSSPSYLILQSLDAANELLADYPEKLQALLPQLESLRRRLAAQGWELLSGEPLKVTLCPKGYGYTGSEVAAALADQQGDEGIDILRQQSQYEETNRAELPDKQCSCDHDKSDLQQQVREREIRRHQFGTDQKDQCAQNHGQYVVSRNRVYVEVYRGVFLYGSLRC